MNRYDILTALEWLSWRNSVKNKKYSQGYLDRMAEKKMRETAASKHVSNAVKQLAQTDITVKSLGSLDEACITMCKTIIKEAREEDFLEMLAHNPHNITQWRKLWDGIRADKLHHI